MDKRRTVIGLLEDILWVWDKVGQTLVVLHWHGAPKFQFGITQGAFPPDFLNSKSNIFVMTSNDAEMREDVLIGILKETSTCF